jgi:dihydroorotate dehydrogenase electron transfer subunit
MASPVHAAYYADRAACESVTIRENVPLAKSTFRVRFDCPRLARRVTPGQFVMLRLAGWDDPLLGRPLALYDTVCSAAGEPVGIDLVYLVQGKMTSRLARMQPGQALEVWGPLGNGFAPQASEHLIAVAGGIGQTPFPALAREHLGLRRYGDPPRPVAKVGRMTLLYGARTRDYLAGVADFELLGVDVQLATDDGSAGQRGFVTDLLERELHSPADRRVVCCGPEPMMARVAEICAARGVPCAASLETPMACGIGICFSCVTRVKQPGGGWDYRRTCVEGPVFDAATIAW